ncbi:MAG: three-Cys-motif partner protein TcmP [Tannerella sp.]|jgi:three-Cys-motif partner protein|nr:three-Cys-motif partner protein TcmP [Tannerella sp.]
MPRKDLHEKPFDEGTITKLEIFENYAREWLPVFIMGGYKELWIFDFFAGTGYDKNGIAGSSIRILQQIKNQINNILQKETKINVCFNEFDNNKYPLLKESCQQFLSDNPELESAKVDIVYYNEDFANIFPERLTTIKKYPSLVYLDQSGMKFMADKYISEFENIKTTDFLYFISSSYEWRYGDTDAFKSILKIDIERAKQNPYKYIHKSILEQLREQYKKLSLYPFTIKKGANVYGIIFGATHPRAVDKFLKTAWDKNEINGEANFDIDDDSSKKQLSLFESKKLTKIESFKQSLRQEILDRKIKNNKDAFYYTQKQGHIPSHSKEEISKMKEGKLIDYEGKSPLITYEQVCQKKRIVEFNLKK